MPMFRKLTPQEARSLTGLGVRKMIEIEYDGYLRDFASGDFGEVLLDENEKRMTVMSRLKAAAHRADLALVFRRSSDPHLLRFQVVDLDTSVPSSVMAETLAPVGSDSPRPQRGGRIRKQS